MGIERVHVLAHVLDFPSQMVNTPRIGAAARSRVRPAGALAEAIQTRLGRRARCAPSPLNVTHIRTHIRYPPTYCCGSRSAECERVGVGARCWTDATDTQRDPDLPRDASQPSARAEAHEGGTAAAGQIAVRELEIIRIQSALRRAEQLTQDVAAAIQASAVT